MERRILTSLNTRRNANLIISAEDDDFDIESLRRLENEGFRIKYVPMGRDSNLKYANRLQAAADQMTGVSEKYAVIAYGDAASRVLETYIRSSPRLCAIVAYYPSVIPDPNRAQFSNNFTVLVHLAGSLIGVRKRPEILGLQGKAKVVQKRLGQGIGYGGDLQLRFRCFKYNDVEAGFAEHDLDEYNEAADGLAWCRTLKALHDSFGISNNMERVRDQYVNELGASDGLGNALDMTSASATILLVPTACGGACPADIRRFYTEYFRPRPSELNARLLSRTTGIDRVVDELELSFKHDREVPWLLPGIPATDRMIRVIMVSIVCIRGGLLIHERVYWDQASVLAQAGLLDPNIVPVAFRGEGVEVLPVVGADVYEAIEDGKGNTSVLSSLLRRLRGYRDSNPV